MEEEDEYNGD